MAVPTLAHDFKLGALRIDHPYATPTPPGATTGAAYVRGIRNTGEQPDRLVGARTPRGAHGGDPPQPAGRGPADRRAARPRVARWKRSTGLLGLGYTVGAPVDIGSVQAVLVDPKSGEQYGAADARREGTVIGLPR